MKKIFGLVLLVATVTAGFAVYRAKKVDRDIPLDEMLATWRAESFEIVSKSNDPLIKALFKGEIRIGSPIESVTSQHVPRWTETYGRYTEYGFDDRGYSWRTLVTYDDRVVRATAGSCTWSWTFFDDILPTDLTTISRIHGLRKCRPIDPQNREKVQIAIEQLLSTLD